MVGYKCVSGRGLRVWAQGGHAGVYKDPQGDVAPPKDSRLHLHDLVEEVDAGRPRPPPVLCSEQRLGEGKETRPQV